jgi:hypothetical protein
LGERAPCGLRAQAAKLGPKPRIDVVEVPAKPLDLGGTLADEVLAMVRQELDLARGGVEVGDREIGLSERRAGDGEGVDRVGLAELALRAAGARHQLRRHADDVLAAGDQLALEPTGDVAAVLDRKPPLRVEAAGPFEQALVAGLVACDRELRAKLAGRRVHRGGGVALLVGVDPDRDHLLRSSYAWRV